MANERTVRRWVYMLVGAFGGIAIWGGPSILLMHHGAFGLTDTARLLARVVAASVGMAWGIVFATLAYRAQEEFTQEADKFAWYWGGAIGAGVSAPIFVFISRGGLTLIGAAPPAGTPGQIAFRAFEDGYLLMAVSLVAGFLVARLWWTVSKR